MRAKISIALLLALTPSLAFAKPKTASSHMRPQLFRDRSPKMHAHISHVHEAKLPPPKSPPPPAVKDDF
jgi:hypothetical protein